MNHRARLGQFALLAIISLTLPPEAPSSPSTNVVVLPTQAATKAPAPNAALIATIEGLVAQRTALRDELSQRRRQLERAAPGPEKESQQQDIDQTVARLSTLQDQVQTLASGADSASFAKAGDEPFEIQQEVIRLVRPLIEQLRRASEQPRMEENLRGAIDKARERLDVAARARDRVASLLGQPGLERDGRRALEEIRDQWEGRRKEAASQLEVAEIQLRQMLDQKKPMIESLAAIARNFFRMRGKNLALALIAAATTFLLFRLLHARLRRSGLRFARIKDSFYSRVTNLALHILSAVAATFAAMLVLYYAGDWVLLGLLILVLLGLGLAARSSIPLFIDEIRILLNLGGVREGERVVIDGIPWRVDKLDFLSTLINPSMPGHVLRLPLRKLRELVSRPSVDREPWFPCREDDWLLLGDGTVAKAITITPEIVEVVRVGGLHKTYPTAAFLALTPANLSRGFRVSSTMGIDYAHQTDCSETIPATLQEHILRRLVETVGREAIRNVKVELRQAAPSSLDFEIQADFDGDVAERYDALHRSLQRFAVEACNANGWIIPFTQITVHKAD